MHISHRLSLFLHHPGNADDRRREGVTSLRGGCAIFARKALRKAMGQWGCGRVTFWVVVCRGQFRGPGFVRRARTRGP